MARNCGGDSARPHERATSASPRPAEQDDRTDTSPVETAADDAPAGALSRRSFVRTTAAAAVAGGVGVGASGRAAASEGIVDDVGRLQVQDAQVCAEDGREVTLGGMSFFWSNWAGQYYTADVVDYLVDEFQVDVVRAACAVGEEGGYGHDPQGNTSKVQTVVDRAIERDVYVVIDWHLEGDAWPHHDDAQQFFAEMAQQYGDYPHVIYEPWNEPTEQSADDIREFCQSIADTIREYDEDNLIVCGSSTWSQNPQSYSIDDPNAAYTFHAYPDAEYGDAHMSSFQTNVPAAMDQGNAVFVTEFGAQYDDHDRTQEFIDQCQEMNISMCAWSVNDKDEPWSIFTSGTNSLTAIGEYYRDQIRNWPEPDDSEQCEPVSPEPSELPGTVQAEDYVDAEDSTSQNEGGAYRCGSVDVEATEDPQGGQYHVSNVTSGEWLEYDVEVPTGGAFAVDARVASNDGGAFSLQVDGSDVASASFDGTGGWESWSTVDVGQVDLDAGSHSVTLVADADGWNVNYLLFEESDVGETCGGEPVEDTATVDGQTVCDVNDDGYYRDVDGDGSVGQGDVAEFFQKQHRSEWKQPDLFDFSGNGEVTHGDVVELFDYVALN